MLARYFLLIVGMGLSMGTGCDSRKGAEYRKLESFMEQRIDLSRLYAPEDLAKKYRTDARPQDCPLPRFFGLRRL